jgi:hypothetical protein
MSDNSPFTGIVRFGPPHYDDNGKFALAGNNIIVNPDGPGIGPNEATMTDHITLYGSPEVSGHECAFHLQPRFASRHHL